MIKLNNRTVIKSISYNQDEILKSIIKLYIPEGRFDLDPTYSKGGFYKGSIPQPIHKTDLYPTSTTVLKADARKLPFENESLKSIIFDPPFVASYGKSLLENQGTKVNNIMHKRFGYFHNMDLLWKFYRDSLKEFRRVLAPNGVLVFKTQDCISSSKQYLSHVEIINKAVNIGFYPIDMFILLAKNRVLSGKHNNQKHARKFHSYFLVFKNCPSKVIY